MANLTRNKGLEKNGKLVLIVLTLCTKYNIYWRFSGVLNHGINMP